MAQVNAIRRYTIDIEGTEAAYIALSNSIWDGIGVGPDSLDAGDATGAFLDYADQHGFDIITGMCVVEGHGCKVTITSKLGPFEWTEKF